MCLITTRNTLGGQVYIHMYIHMYEFEKYLTFVWNAEKWALCYRDFDHNDTDTNMLVERFVIIECL